MKINQFGFKNSYDYFSTTLNTNRFGRFNSFFIQNTSLKFINAMNAAKNSDQQIPFVFIKKVTKKIVVTKKKRRSAEKTKRSEKKVRSINETNSIHFCEMLLKLLKWRNSKLLLLMTIQVIAGSEPEVGRMSADFLIFIFRR